MESKTVKIVFTGGTGRCGTNILKAIFSRHSKIATLPFEHRFFIDPDGLVDFYTSYPQAWSPFWADKRLQRLEKFLREISHVNGIHRLLERIVLSFNREGKFISPKKYCRWELSKHFPDFERNNRELIQQLREFTYIGVWPGTESYSFRPCISHAPPKSKETLAEIIGNYMRRVIRGFLSANGAEIFFEDNTWNIFFARELLELLPESKIVHIYRDPRDVVASFSQQRWCPSDKIKAALWYKTMIEYWLYVVRKGLPADSYSEVKLEALVKSPEITLRRLCEFIRLPFEDSMLDVDLSKSHSGRWRNEFSQSEEKEISIILGPIIYDLGYE